MKMLNKNYIELVKKYSFIDDVKILGGDFIIYYDNKSKKLPLRSSPKKLQEILNKLKKKLVKNNEEKLGSKGISICAF